MVQGVGANTPLERVLSRLSDHHPAGSGFAARCPAHEDMQASLSISAGDDGRALLHCHAGCETSAIVKALKLEMRDLFPVNANGHANGKPARKIGATYDYRDEVGDYLFSSIRYDPKDFKQAVRKAGGGWTWTVMGIRQVPYRLPELLAADASTVAFAVEGEKDVDNIRKRGGVATCNAGGSGKWRAEFAEHLIGRRVAILPDNDDAGRKHAAGVARSLVGKAVSIKVIELPGLPKKGDVSDYFAAGGTMEELLRIVEAAPEWKPAHSTYALTDSGNAERFAAQHGDTVLYCYPWKTWLAYDGKRWDRDCGGLIDRAAKKTVRSIYTEAAEEPDANSREAIVKFARQSESAIRRAAMIRLAQSEEGIPVQPDDLDTDPWALACHNGIIDLRRGQLLPHNPKRLFTKLCPVVYDPGATCPQWLAFLDRTFNSRQQLIAFIRRLLGYWLTGDVSEQILAIFFGVGANGKTTLLTTFMEMFGADFAMKAPQDLLMAKKGAHPTERADLFGKRFVACIETDKNRRLAEALTKELVGGDRIRARRICQDSFEFAPTHKIVLAANHKPVIRGTDHAMWRRIRLVPFDVVIPPAEQDKHLLTKLRAELPGILAWCVQGCLQWQRDGLGEPQEVAEATGDYELEEDTLLRFLTECCETGPDLRVKASDLLRAFNDWTGEKVSQREFGNALTEKGIRRFKSNGTWYSGLGLPSAE
jgi:putative DNA primase/helicase